MVTQNETQLLRRRALIQQEVAYVAQADHVIFMLKNTRAQGNKFNGHTNQNRPQGKQLLHLYSMFHVLQNITATHRHKELLLSEKRAADGGWPCSCLLQRSVVGLEQVCHVGRARHSPVAHE